MEKIAVHVKGFHNLLVGDENSMAISYDVAKNFGLDVDGDFIMAKDEEELGKLRTLLAFLSIGELTDETD